MHTTQEGPPAQKPGRRAARRFPFVLSLLTVAAAATPAALAQTGARLLVEPFPKEQAMDVRAETYIFDGGHTQKTDRDFDFRTYSTEGKFRLEPGNVISPRVGYQFTYLDPNSPLLPRRLVDMSVGVATPIGKYEDWVFGLSVGAGYAGDSFFGDGDAYYGKATLGAIRQLDEHTGLAFFLDYNRNRAYVPDIPLPGIAYTRVLSDELEMTLGLPVSSIRWKPQNVPGLDVELNYYLPYIADLKIGYQLADHLTVFGRVQSIYESFFIDGQPSNHDRLLFQQRRAEAGLRWEPRDGFQFEAAVGYGWNGEFTVGFDQRDSKTFVDVSDEPYVRLGLEIRF